MFPFQYDGSLSNQTKFCALQNCPNLLKMGLSPLVLTHCKRQDLRFDLAWSLFEDSPAPSHLCELEEGLAGIAPRMCGTARILLTWVCLRGPTLPTKAAQWFMLLWCHCYSNLTRRNIEIKVSFFFWIK